MTRLRLRAPRSIAFLGLLAFTIGSQHCSIGAWRGDRTMACMALPSATAEAPTTGSCCHAAKHAPGPASTTTSDRSCCIHPGPLPASPTLAVFADSSPLDGVLAADLLEPAAPSEVSTAWIPADRPPPEAPALLLHLGRAPPIADLV